MIDGFYRSGRLCRFPQNEQQPSVDRSLGEAAALGNSPAPGSRSGGCEVGDERIGE